MFDGFTLSRFSSSVPQPEQLLKTKLHIPPIHTKHVFRPRLVSRLDESLDCKLTLISAPVGFGKTTLLSEWIHNIESRFPVAWISLDERDNDPIRLFAYIVTAFRSTISDDFNDAILSGDMTQISFIDLLTGFLNTIVTVVPNDFVLVFDDYHVINSNSVHETLNFILDHMPSNMHLVISTRIDPPLPLAQLRARGQLVELRASDLRFSIDEEMAFLNQIMGLSLSREEIAELDKRIEGWVAGMQLAALSMQECQDSKEFIQAFTGTHRHLVDYLMEQVLLRQDSDRLAFLFETSILERLTGPLCDAVTGRKDSLVMLEKLEAANLFIVPLDDKRCWYRYHHLFSDILRNRLNILHPDRIPDLHQRASEWCEFNNFIEDAVHYSLMAKNYHKAMQLIEKVVDILWERNEIITVLNWMKVLPEDLVSTNPRIGLTYAVALANTGQLDLVEPLLRSVEENLKKGELFSSSMLQGLSVSNDITGTSTDYKEWHYSTFDGLLTMIDIRRAFVARYSDNLSDAIKFSVRALDRIPSDNLYMRGIAWLFNGHAHLLTGDSGGAEKALTRAISDSQTSGHLAAYLNAAHFLAQLRIFQGRLHDAAEIYQQAVQLLAQQKRETVFAGIERVGIGDLLREWNDLESATRNLQIGIHQIELSGDFEFLRDGYIAGARLGLSSKNFDNALAFIRKSANTVRRNQLAWDTALIDAWQARIWLAQGDLAAAERWAQLSGLSLDDELCFINEFGHMILARVFMAKGMANEARNLLEKLIRFAGEAGRMGCVLEMLVLQSLILRADNDTIGALSALKRALILAEPEGYIRTFVDEGPPIAELLLLGISRNTWNKPHLLIYAHKLLSCFGIEPIQQHEITKPCEHEAITMPLSIRELQVLQLVAGGASNKEIAQRLSVTVSTVKAHLRSINDKLDVSSRTQAVARARSLHLLP
jgi:LuxR family transcriptional regulator, maltose regulon positive regulatory protein